MIPIDGQPILTAAQMRAAEELAAPTPESMYDLMERAGAGVADAVRRMACGAEVLVLCGPGNNGGDGYVAARILRQGGASVRVASLTPPRTAMARKAAASWNGPAVCYTTGDQTQKAWKPWRGEPPKPAAILVDALFGTGGREAYAREPWVDAHRCLFEQARVKIAVDLPLGLSPAGEHRPPGSFAHADLTLALGALKPVHVLPLASTICGDVRMIDLGLDLSEAPVRVMERPIMRDPDAESHKFTRGMVGVIAGAMPGAAELAAIAAARAGAGYVVVFGAMTGGPASLVHRPLTREALSDPRLDAVVIGPGLGRDDDARGWLRWLVTETRLHLVIDGDALHLLDPAWLDYRSEGVVLTPHEGEHQALTVRLRRSTHRTGDPFGTSMAEIKSLGTCATHVMVHKGATTVIANRRNARVSPHGSPWLSTAGSGDVLAGAIAATLAMRRHKAWPLLDAVAAGVWLHAEAARLCGASFIADDLAHALTKARASL